MAKPAVSRNAFRALFALYAKADHKHNGDYCVLKLPGSAKGIPDRLLQQWSHQADLPGAEAIASTLEPRTREIVNGRKRYDHASDFLHVLLRDLELREH
ncbi:MULTISPECIES: hypothetical protein [Bradyrhizobium]|jgi:hypothetical protein|uniref:Uncharacterized protein n=1 Tax=Bradyrhizobium canariense TaxID=255045 RepID=A0A1X3HAY7_9BRAD|nr:hypothetical protein [Bradyrhizobium canariense]MBM7481746.1 hypothetical protein [Bradyrhizobium canariense]OSI60585.1 hypothetical protein BSZ21_34490 [Bradyrhizobium canariense]OSI72478.1 hypothetical protein BSZ22_08425 [Bradyrhizobium canariense]OSI80844.1 hypothetical protein BSZ23_09040 [Bradyrhizobium canariense]OSI93773.1 hypothetical protein BSZ25_08345 [Bradyrhizobium canariense]